MFGLLRRKRPIFFPPCADCGQHSNNWFIGSHSRGRYIVRGGFVRCRYTCRKCHTTSTLQWNGTSWNYF